MIRTARPSTTPVLPVWAYVTALAAVAVVSRLPQLLSPNLLLEGDECILGLMGMHVAHGRDFPLFFYGQKYGLAIVEGPAAALSFLIAGASPISLKVAMLAIWILGIAFYFLAFSRVFGARRSFWSTLLLVLMPAWAATSMKAWSGYITAFSATALVIYLINRNENRRAVPWLLAGGVSGLIYFSQPLWLPGLMPIVVFFLISSRKVSCWLSYVSGALLVVLGINAIKTFWLTGAVETWTGPQAGNPHLLASLPALLKQVHVTLTGAYYFGTALRTGTFTATTAYIWLGCAAAAAFLQIYRLIVRKPLLWSHLLFLSMIATLLANWGLLEWRDARYMLPVNVPLVFMAGVEFFDLIDRYHVSRAPAIAAVALVLALQAVAMTEFARYSYMWWTNGPHTPSETRTMHTLIGHLRSRGVTHVYAMNALLQWPIMFYSREAVVARWKAGKDRYPAYVHRVDGALDHGAPVAIVGYVGYSYGLENMVRDPQSIIKVDGKYFIYVGADKDLLRRAGFQFSR
jgi:hypothetical protein